MDIPNPTPAAVCRHPRTSTNRFGNGHTLVELVVTLSVVAVMAAGAAPTLHTFVKRNRLAAHINTFVGHLQLARSSAVKHGQRVVICQSRSGTGCERAGGWQHGWLMFLDPNANRELDEGEQVLRVQDKAFGDLLIGSGRRRRVVYQPSGFSPGTNATFTFCVPSAPQLAHAVIVSNTGRPRVTQRAADGGRLDCG